MKVKRGYLYLVDLSPRFGTEPGKKRPAVVIQSDLLNDVGHPSTWVIPCTTQLTESNILRVRLPVGSAGNEKECDVMIDQSRAIDNRRFDRVLDRIPALLFKEILEKIRLVGEI
jgi:mRNA interferase MazF